MKRIAALALALSLAAGSLTGCSSRQTVDSYTPTGSGLTSETGSTRPTGTAATDSEQSLTMVYYPDRSLNPYTRTDYTNRALFSLIDQGLVSVDRDYQVQPVLCGRYSVSQDLKSYVFYPVSGATFSDGSALTAADVAASLKAASESPYYSGRFLHVQSIALTSGGGVSVTLDTACENLPMLLDIPIVQQSQVAAAQPLGTGPYVFASAAGAARLNRRTGWWCQAEMATKADFISLTVAESNAQIRDQFEFYDVGLVCADPCSDTYADYRCDYELWDCENGVFLYLGCNLSSEVFSNATVRSALTYAIDREKLSLDYYRSFGRPASLPISPRSPWYSETLAQQYTYDAGRFAQAVAGANLSTKDIVLLVNSDDSLRLRAARAIGDMLTAGGLKVTLSELATADYQEAYKQGNYDLYLGQTRLSPNMDLTAFFSPWGGLSYGGMDDGAIYAMCLKALENSGNYYDLCRLVMNDGRLCPILFGGYAVYADRGLISDLAPSRDNIFYYSLGTSLQDILDDAQAEDPTVPTEPETSEPETSAPDDTEPAE